MAKVMAAAPDLLADCMIKLAHEDCGSTTAADVMESHSPTDMHQFTTQIEI